MGKFQRKSKDQKQTSIAPIGRKQKRKEERKKKKELKNAYFKKRSGKHVIQEEEQGGNELKEHVKGKKGSGGHNLKDDVNKLKEAASSKRKKMLKQANEEEDKAIERLSKQLNLNKKKKGKVTANAPVIPKSFMDDGLGYILEACDAETLGNINDFDNSDQSDNEDMDNQETNSLDKEVSNQSCSEDEDDEDQVVSGIGSDMEEDDNEEIEDEQESELEEGQSDKEGSDEEGSESEEDAENSDQDMKEITKEDKTKETWEDIYGRKRDAEGNVVATKYVPPALRNQAGSNDLARLEKQLKGQLNRLAESNMQSISRLIEDLYARNSRNDMNVCIVKIMKSSILQENALTPERLVMEHACLISLLHANVGTEVGATVTQKWVESFMHEYNCSDLDDEENATKILDNYLHFTAFLYAFRIFGHELMFDLFSKFVESYKLKDIELIILLLRNVGFNLRKDDPVKLKDLIMSIQKKAAEEGDNVSGRTKFMLESLLAIKNNNVKKLPNYDPTYQVHLLKVMRTFLRPGAEVTPLNVHLEDLLKADSRGRWWIVGSAWTGREMKEDENKSLKRQDRFSDKLLEKAKEMRMNTDARRTIFCTLMSSSDYMDAFEKLSKVDFKSPLKEREIAFVLTRCCVDEPTFNPFYAHVASKLAREDRKFRMSIQCAIWDRISGIIKAGKKSSYPAGNLALFTSRLIRDKVLTLTCLKKVEFADMNKSLTLYLKTLIKDVLKEDNDRERNLHFALIANNEKLSMLRESLRLFMHHFLLRSKKETDPLLKSRVENAENALLSSSMKVY